MKTNELSAMDVPALKDELVRLSKEQFNLRMQKSTGQLKNTHVLKDIRRMIARVKTFLHAKEVQS